MVAVISEDKTYIEVVKTVNEGRNRAKEISDLNPEIHYYLIQCQNRSDNKNYPDFSEYDIIEGYNV